MDTNTNAVNSSLWSAEFIKAVASLWALALIGLLILGLLSIVIFFRPQFQRLLDRIQNFIFKRGQTEFSVNQAAAAKAEKVEPAPDSSAPVSKSDTAEKKAEAQEEQGELEWEPRTEMFHHAWLGNPKKRDEAFEKLQSKATDPEDRIKNEAQYLNLCFETGDSTAQKKLKDLEAHSKGFPKVLGIIVRFDAKCYEFGGDLARAAETYKRSAELCVSDEGKARSISGVGAVLYEAGLKTDAFAYLKEGLGKVNDPDALVRIYDCLADLYEKEGDQFTRAIILQRALSLKSSSPDLNFRTAHAFSKAGEKALAIRHYEKLIAIDHKHSGAYNNIAVAFAAIGAPTLAVKYYKLAISLGETLPAANLANILIDAGDLDEASKILKDAQLKSEVHSNVNHSFVAIDRARDDDDEKRTASLKLASAQNQFFLHYADALMRSAGTQPSTDGKWMYGVNEIVDLKFNQSTQDLELTWTEITAPVSINTPEKFQFKGQVTAFAANGTVCKFGKDSWSGLLGKSEGSFQKYGTAYAYFEGSSCFRLLIQKSDSQEYTVRSFTKV